LFVNNHSFTIYFWGPNADNGRQATFVPLVDRYADFTVFFYHSIKPAKCGGTRLWKQPPAGLAKASPALICIQRLSLGLGHAAVIAGTRLCRAVLGRGSPPSTVSFEGDANYRHGVKPCVWANAAGHGASKSPLL